jgi:hypothetical protein
MNNRRTFSQHGKQISFNETFGEIGYYSGGFYHPKNIFIYFNSGGNMPSLTCQRMK